LRSLGFRTLAEVRSGNVLAGLATSN
jgi:hypothetical protein